MSNIPDELDQLDFTLPLGEQPYWYVLYLERLAKEEATSVQYFNPLLSEWRSLSPNLAPFQTDRDNTYPTAMTAFRPTPIETKDSIDWSHVHEDLKYLRVKEDGEAYLFDKEPQLLSEEGPWIYSGIAVNIDNIFSSYKRGNIPWNKMILDRP